MSIKVTRHSKDGEHVGFKKMVGGRLKTTTGIEPTRGAFPNTYNIRKMRRLQAVKIGPRGQLSAKQSAIIRLDAE